MSPMSLRTELPTAALSEVLLVYLSTTTATGYIGEIQYSVSSITNDEDRNKENKVVASKKRPDVYVFHVQ
jgi:hypothetical protein